jgi:hypothetical protein
MAEIRTLLRDAAPTPTSGADLESITRQARRRRLQRRGLATVACLASATFVSLGALVAVNHHHGGAQRLSVQSPPASTPSRSGPNSRGDTTAPTTVCPSISLPVGQEIICPATTAEAEQLIGSALPPPATPPGFALGLSELFRVQGHPAETLFERTWTPAREFGPHGATGAYLELRVSRDGPHGGQPPLPVQPGATTIMLTNGTKAFETGSDRLIGWSHAGLQYTLETTQMSPTDLLRAANSLP